MTQCSKCGFEFPPNHPDLKKCPWCGVPVVGNPLLRASHVSDERELYRTELSKWEGLRDTEIFRVTTKHLISDVDRYLLQATPRHDHYEQPLDQIESVELKVWDENSRRRKNGCPCSVIIKWKNGHTWELDTKMREDYTHGIRFDFVSHANEIMEAIQKARRLAGLV